MVLMSTSRFARRREVEFAASWVLTAVAITVGRACRSCHISGSKEQQGADQPTSSTWPRKLSNIASASLQPFTASFSPRWSLLIEVV